MCQWCEAMRAQEGQAEQSAYPGAFSPQSSCAAAHPQVHQCPVSCQESCVTAKLLSFLGNIKLEEALMCGDTQGACRWEDFLTQIDSKPVRWC